MPAEFLEASPRNFNPMSIPGLSDEARKAVSAAFKAVSTWRRETVNNSEKNSEQVINKMAAAAQALGWPEQIVDTIRTQLQGITKMQIEMMDRMVDVWEEQLKSPNASAMLSELKSLPNFGPAGNWPIADVSQAALNPFRSYMQFVEQWQKAWADVMASWSKAGPHRQ
jgi:hypothetical protein